MSTNKAPKEKVIDLVHGAEEDGMQRLFRKHVPAWVISGVLHVTLSLGLLLLFKLMGPQAAAQPPVEDVAVAVEDQVEPPPPQEDLTRLEEGIDSNLETSLNLEREDKVNVEEMVTNQQAIGSEMATESIPQDSFKQLGQPADLMTGGTR